MNGYFHFILDSGISLGVLTLIYLLVLRRETCFRFNRAYLIVSVVFSMIFPFITIPIPVHPIENAESIESASYIILEQVPMVTQTCTVKASSVLNEFGCSGLIYLTGVILFLSLFIYRLVSLGLLIRKSVLIQRRSSFRVVTCKAIASPFSFFHYILIPEDFNDSSKLERILIHEAEHVRQKHSLDVLIMQLLTIVQWCNPFIWLVNRFVRENHEYLADRAVLNRGFSPSGYKLLLLTQVAGEGFLITNNFNYSLIKSRIFMMSKDKSSKGAYARSFFGIAIGILLLFTVRVHADTLSPEAILKDNSSINSMFSYVNRIAGLVNENGIMQYGSQNAAKNGTSILRGNDISQATDQKVVLKRSIRFIPPPVWNVDEKPRFEDGNSELITYIVPIDKNNKELKNLRFPSDTNHPKLEVKTTLELQTFIDEKGNIVRADVVKSSSNVDKSLLDFYSDVEKVKRLFKKLKIIPGKKDGRPVSSRFTFPVIVKAYCKGDDPIKPIPSLACKPLK